MLFSRKEIITVANRMGWDYVVRVDINIPEDLIEEFFEEIPVIELYLQSKLSKRITDIFGGYIRYKELEKIKRFNGDINMENLDIPRLPGRRNNFGI